MRDIATATVSGNLTREVEVRPLPSGTEVARLRVASGSRRLTIPILVAGDALIDGEQAILAYLQEHFSEPPDAEQHRVKAARAKRKELEEACPKLAAATP